jgi:hypothetical protein
MRIHTLPIVIRKKEFFGGGVKWKNPCLRYVINNICFVMQACTCIDHSFFFEIVVK